MSVYLETKRLILRDWQDGDLEHFARINNDAVIMEFYPSRLDDAASAKLVKHFQEHINKHGYGFFAVENKEDGRFVGFAGLSHVPTNMPFAPAVELAWRMDYNFWGKGYATEATRALLTFGFDECDLKEIVAYCVQGNDRAQHVLDRLGFEHDTAKDFTYAPRRLPNDKADYSFYTMKAPA